MNRADDIYAYPNGHWTKSVSQSAKRVAVLATRTLIRLHCTLERGVIRGKSNGPVRLCNDVHRVALADLQVFANFLGHSR
jgi:hypothetical protein